MELYTEGAACFPAIFMRATTYANICRHSKFRISEKKKQKGNRRQQGLPSAQKDAGKIRNIFDIILPRLFETNYLLISRIDYI